MGKCYNCLEVYNDLKHGYCESCYELIVNNKKCCVEKEPYKIEDKNLTMVCKANNSLKDKIKELEAENKNLKEGSENAFRYIEALENVSELEAEIKEKDIALDNMRKMIKCGINDESEYKRLEAENNELKDWRDRVVHSSEDFIEFVNKDRGYIEKQKVIEIIEDYNTSHFMTKDRLIKQINQI
jgi:hypothetical protein